MLTVGARMVRQDDGMRGVVEMVDVTANYQEPRVVYIDRGEKRIAPKKEKWDLETPPPRKLRDEERLRVAVAADRMLCAIERNEPQKWWDWSNLERVRDLHDFELVRLIDDYLSKRA